MLNANKEQISLLVELQVIDSETRRIRTKLADLPEQSRKLDEELSTSQQSLAEKQNALLALQKHYREMELEFKSNQANIRKSNEKLFSIKSNKEYQAILKEIEDIHKRNSTLEDEMIISLDRIDAEEKTLIELKNNFKSLESDISDERQSIQKVETESNEKLVELETHWRGMAEKVPEPLLRRFNLVREQARGLAIVPVVDAVCKGCNMNIPPQMYNELHRFDALNFCPHCHRIIYWNGKARSESSRRSPDQQG